MEERTTMTGYVAIEIIGFAFVLRERTPLFDDM
jgi:hypothetical protein